MNNRNKKPKLKDFNFLKKSLIIAALSILISFCNNLYFSYITKDENKKALMEQLYNMGKDEKNLITNLYKEILYEIKLYSNMDSFKDMDKDKVVDVVTFIKANKSRYANIVVLNKNKDIFYGYVERDDYFAQSDGLENALSRGELVSETKKINDKYYLELYSPVKKNKEVVSIIFFRVDLDEINFSIKNLTNKSITTESYLVDRNGVFMTESKFISSSIGNLKIDIKTLKLNIDYNAENSYKDYRNIPVYGRYFSLEIDNWTLIVETDVTDKETSPWFQTLGHVAALSQGALIFVIQYILKSNFNIDIGENEILSLMKGDEPSTDEETISKDHNER